MSSLDNYEIVPAVVTKIRHRSECIPYYDAFYSDEQGDWCLSGAYLPIIVAPMASVINDQNYLKFDEQGLMTVMPRTIPLSKRIELLDKLLFVAFGMDEFKAFIAEHDSVPEDTKICLDLANGHMKEVLDVCKQAKEKFGNNLELMAGNIANPATYLEYAKAGIDYCRLGIGSGNACFPAGTKITMRDGSKKDIECVDKGEIVKTLNGTGTVTNVFTKKANTLIKINDELECTPDHKLFVINKTDKEKVNENNINNYGFWIEAQNLNDNYLLVQV